jgi:hypothetical protein
VVLWPKADVALLFLDGSPRLRNPEYSFSAEFRKECFPAICSLENKRASPRRRQICCKVQTRKLKSTQVIKKLMWAMVQARRLVLKQVLEGSVIRILLWVLLISITSPIRIIRSMTILKLTNKDHIISFHQI